MKNGFVHIRTVAEKVITKMEEHGKSGSVWESMQNHSGITTGFAELDRVLGELYPGGVYLVAARPGMGKTAFALQVALNTLQNAKKPVYFFSNLLTAEELLMRLLSQMARIDNYSMRRGLLTEGEWEAAASALAFLSETELYVSRTLFPEAEDIADFIRDEVRDGLVVIDGIQEVCCNGNRPFHTKIMDMAQIAAVSREFKLAAAEAGVPVMITSHLTRTLETRKDKRPLLGDLENAVGIMEGDADGVFFLYRGAYYYEKENSEKADVILATNRWGGVTRVTVGFDGSCTRFYDIEK